MLNSLLKKAGLKFSLNDPGWGRGSNDKEPNGDQKEPPPRNNGRRPGTPPELDQLWRDFNQRINLLFNKNGGGRPPGGNGRTGGPEFSGKNAGVGVVIVVIVVALLWLASGFFIVQEGQTGVVMTFGKSSRMAGAGFNWRWPAPIQSDEVVNVSQVRTSEIGYRTSVKNKQDRESLMLTGDENMIDIQFAVQYKIKNAADWLFNNSDTNDIVKLAAESAIREVAGRSEMDFVLYEGREQIAQDVVVLMQKILDNYKSGVDIINVTMQTVQPPEPVQVAFDDAVKAGQDRERLKNEAQAYANDVIPKAHGAAARLMEEAQGYRDRVVSTAQGDASRFDQVLAAYKNAPAITRDRMYLDTMQQIYSNTAKVMIESRNNNNLLYLPLDKLISQTAAGEIGKAAQPAPGATTATPAAQPPAVLPAPAAATPSANDPLYPSDNPYLRSRDLRSEGR